MRWRVPVSLLVLFLAAGCTGNGAREAALQAQNDALRQEIKAAEVKRAELERELSALQTKLTELSSKKPETPSPQQPAAAVPNFVCAGLATHMYTELSRGKSPVEMLDATVQFGFMAKGYPTVRSTPATGVDFAPVIAWVKENPVSLIEEVHLIRSQPGYQRVDLRLTNGFFVSALCRQYQILNFLILDHAPGMT